VRSSTHRFPADDTANAHTSDGRSSHTMSRPARHK
jgi:hypothetical protein